MDTNKLIAKIKENLVQSDEYLEAPDAIEDPGHEQGWNDALKWVMQQIEELSTDDDLNEVYKHKRGVSTEILDILDERIDNEVAMMVDNYPYTTIASEVLLDYSNSLKGE